MRIQITIDCTDPGHLVRFWSTALGYIEEEPPDGSGSWVTYWRNRGMSEEELAEIDGADSIVDPTGVGPRIWFQVVPEAKVVKNRLHLDLGASGGREVPLDVRRERVRAKAAELVAAGATQVRVLETEGLDHFGITMADPEGNEFCVH